MRRILRFFMLTLVCSMCWNVASAQKIYAGDPYKWNELKAGDEILLNNGGAYSDDVAGYGGPGQFLCGYTVAQNGYVAGITLAKTDTLNESKNTDPTGNKLTDANVWILVDAGTITDIYDEEYQAFYLKNKKTGEYIECFESTPTATDFVSHTTPQLAKATSFVPQPVDSYDGVKKTTLKKYEEDPDYGVIFSHYVVTTKVNSETGEEEQEGTWWHLGYFWNYTYSYYGTAVDMVGWNALKPVEGLSPKMLLEMFMTSIAGAEFNAGTDPGYFGADEVIAYEDALLAAQDAFDYEDPDAPYSDEEWQGWYDDLKAAYDAVVASQVPLSDGLYYIIMDNQQTLGYREGKGDANVPAFQARSDMMLWWASLDEEDPSFVWRLTKVGVEEDGTPKYTVQNYGLSTYIAYDMDNNEGFVCMSKDVVSDYDLIVRSSDGRWKFRCNTPGGMQGNKSTARGIYADCMGAKAHNSHTQLSTSYDDAQHQTLRRPTDEQLAILEPKVAQMKLTSELEALLDPALTLYNVCFKYNPDKENGLLKVLDEEGHANYDSPMTNTGNDGSYKGLIDGLNEVMGTDYSYYFRTYGGSSDDAEYKYLVFDFIEPQQNIVIEMSKRNAPPGQGDRPAEVILWGSNTEGDILGDKEWTKIEVYYPTTENAVLTDVHSVDLGQPYRYLKYSVSKTYNYMIGNDSRSWAFCWFAIGEMQIYPGTLDTETSQYYYVDGMKDAADELKKQLGIARVAVGENTATQQNIDDLQAAIDALKGMVVDTIPLYARTLEVENYVNRFPAGLDYGQTTDEELAAMEAAIENAKGFDHEKPQKADLEARMANLNAAFETFKAAQKPIEENTWLYIQCTDQTRTGEPDADGNYVPGNAIVNGHVMYVASGNTYGDVRAATAADRLLHGLYDTESETQLDLDNPFSMWRAIKQEDGSYAFQNRGTGTYIGVFGSNTYGGMSAEPVSYALNFVAPGEFEFVCNDGTNSDKRALTAYEDTYVATTAASGGAGSTTATWTVLPVESEAFTFSVPNNTYQIVTLPYDAKSLSVNENVKAYSVKSATVTENQDEESECELVLTPLTEDPKAGEPFILVVGDPSQFNAEGASPAPEETTMFFIEVPSDDNYVTEAKTVNGLVGLLNGADVAKGMGYFVDNTLTSTRTKMFMSGMSGYINPQLAQKLGDPTDEDIVLNASGLDAIKSVKAVNVTGNVYSIDGKLVSKSGTKNLNKGIYIVGKKKVAVK
jgi:hypothetical protein